MNDIIIFYGPKSHFQQLLPYDNIKTLTEIASEHDEKRRIFQIEGRTEKKEKEYIENFVIYTDEYSGVMEHVILNFINFIAFYNIDNIYLQNPPMQIKKQMEKRFVNELKIIEHEYKKLDYVKLEKVFHNFDENIIGQCDVKYSLARSLLPLTRTNHKKPIVLLFYGPTGVGKTETAKYLCNIFEEKLFRKQFSMFQNNEFANYLFGGKHTQNSFAKDLLERESNVILLDEFDKSYSVFHSAFYQLFDEGIYEDQNYSLDVTNAIIICTTNYKNELEIKNNLGLAIYSRFNNVVEFKKLDKNAIDRIIKVKIEELQIELSEEEKRYIDFDFVEKTVTEYSKKINNVRRVENIIRDFFAEQILKGMQFYKEKSRNI